MSTRTYRIVLPEASDDLGRWLDRNGGNISIDCALGTYNVTVSWRKVHSYSDDAGMHRESWEISRHGKDLRETIAAALEAAMARSAS